MTPEEEVVQPEVECNTCGWNGNISDLELDDEGEICPDCGSDNLYYFK